MLRYALLRHECPDDYRDGPHWDLMLERPETADERRLATWSLLMLPTEWSRTMRLDCPVDPQPLATRLEDHRAAYLDYEGPVSGGRGGVCRLAGGPIEWRVVKIDRVEVQLVAPSPLVGLIELAKPTPDAPWRLVWR